MSIAACIIMLPLVGLQPEPGSPSADPPPAEIMAEQSMSEPPPPGQGKDSEPPTDQLAGSGVPAEQAAGQASDIVVTARPTPPPGDPLQTLNADTFSVVQSVDKAVTGPVALAYKKTIPAPARSGVRNFLNNLQEPVVFLNYLLQLKIGKSAETLGRFAINSTIGAAGLFDVAKRRPFNLPHRKNGFGYTLACYGVRPGPYMYLPLIGPTTLRDLSGRMVDLSVLPAAVGKPLGEPAYAIPTTAVRLLDERAEADDEIRAVRAVAADPYITVREHYLQTRQAEVDALCGKHRDEAPPSTEAEPAGGEALGPDR